MIRMAYCYEMSCPIRTKERPYPYGQPITKGSKAPNCPHCGKEMTITANLDEME